MAKQYEQYALFDIPEAPVTEAKKVIAVAGHTRTIKAPHNRTASSKDGAKLSDATGATHFQATRVLELVRKAGSRGTTRADIAMKMRLPASTICARVNALMKAGLIEQEGERRIPDCGGPVRQLILRATS